MNVSSVQSTQPGLGVDSLAAVDPIDLKRAALQMALLRKSLEAQQQQTSAIMREMEGKGQIVDVRV